MRNDSFFKNVVRRSFELVSKASVGKVPVRHLSILDIRFYGACQKGINLDQMMCKKIEAV